MVFTLTVRVTGSEVQFPADFLYLKSVITKTVDSVMRGVQYEIEVDIEEIVKT